MTEPTASSSAVRRLLLVEDSVPDVHILQRVLRDSGSGVELHIARDGQEAIDELVRQARDKPATLPELILLDLHLPKLGGLEVLKRVRELPQTMHLPVIVWSTSRQQEDVRDVYLAGGNSYVQKPRDFPQYREVIEALLRYWFRIVQLPAPTSERSAARARETCP